MFATWLAAQTEGEEDSDRERESDGQEPGEKKPLPLCCIAASRPTCWYTDTDPLLAIGMKGN